MANVLRELPGRGAVAAEMIRLVDLVAAQVMIETRLASPER